MALTFANSGNTNFASPATSMTVNAQSGAVGDFLIAIVALDNGGSSGAALSPVTIATSGSNPPSWTQRLTVNRTAGAVNDGATLHIFTAPVTTAFSSRTTTVSFPSCEQGSLLIFKVTPAAGNTVEWVGSSTTATGSSTTPSVGPLSVTDGYTVVGAFAIETDDVITGDSDTTNGSWSSIVSVVGDGGVDADAQRVLSQHKTVSATGNQTYNVTGLGAARDWAGALFVIRELAAAGGLIKVWNGSAWVEKPVKVWNGSAWVQKPVKVWNGSSWVLA